MGFCTRSNTKSKEVEFISLLSSDDEEISNNQSVNTNIKPIIPATLQKEKSTSLNEDVNVDTFHIYITNKNVKVHYVDNFKDSKSKVTEVNKFKIEGKESKKYLISGEKSEMILSEINEITKKFNNKEEDNLSNIHINKEKYNKKLQEDSMKENEKIPLKKTITNETNDEQFYSFEKDDKQKTDLNVDTAITNESNDKIQNTVEENQNPESIDNYSYEDNTYDNKNQESIDDYVYEDNENDNENNESNQEFEVANNNSIDNVEKVENSDAKEEPVTKNINIKQENKPLVSKPTKSSKDNSLIDDGLEDDLFFFASSDDDECDENLPEVDVKDQINIDDIEKQSIGEKRKADEMDDDDGDEFNDFLDTPENNDNKVSKDIESFFDDDEEDDNIMNVSNKSKNILPPKIDKPTGMSSLSRLVMPVATPQIVKRQRTSLSSIIGDRASSSTSKTPEPKDKEKDKKVRVSIIAQLTGLEKCILVIDVKEKKPLKSILPKAIAAVLNQNNKPENPMYYNEYNCYFFHNKIELSPHITISDLRLNQQGESNIELTLVSRDQREKMLHSDYELMQTMQKQEERMKILDARLKYDDLDHTEKEWAQKISNLREQEIDSETNDGNGLGSEEEEEDDGKFNIKLLDKANKPLVIKVSSEMTISDIFNIYKEKKQVPLSAKVSIMFDGDVVELDETLDKLGLEDDDMLEFVVI
ncbi:hypothetical protein HANVADRAFT_51935 [Hanseniaspora valbyensis NRRL Y-1626]|uniref:Ubiquitin-like domain-containing protein n=1 Tax=Hanseniaspora valbyensis NRRL Y-1626 TaxID=766949 RepID=A0A1B7TGJ9_9ASCO|nr:hypothetical protein HANVADRAFT_51935 [Hanseniaspora valbyensis NRRL Y-1626]